MMDIGNNRYFLYALQAIQLDNLLKHMPSFMPKDLQDFFYNMAEAISNLCEANVEKASEHNEKAYQAITQLAGTEAKNLTPVDELKELLLIEFMMKVIKECVRMASEQ